MPRCDNVTLRTRTAGSGVYDHGYVLADERVADHTPGDGRPKHRLWRIRAGRIVTATGAIERPLSFAGNDIPGVMLASAVRDYVVNYAVSPGDRTVVVTNNDDAYRTAIALKEAGLDVPAILDARETRRPARLPNAARAARHPDRDRHAPSPRSRAASASPASRICAQAGEGAVLEEIACEAVAMSGGWSPVVHLWSHCGGKLTLGRGACSAFRPRPRAPAAEP